MCQRFYYVPATQEQKFPSIDIGQSNAQRTHTDGCLGCPDVGKGSILNKGVIRNCNDLGFWNKIKSNKK